MSAGRAARAEWIFIAVLAVSCAVLAVLQFRWTGQITRDERDRARVELSDRLQSIRGDLDQEFRVALAREDGRSLPGAGAGSAPDCLFHGSEFVERSGDWGHWLTLDSQGRPVPAAPPNGSTSGFVFEAPPPGTLAYMRGFVIGDARIGRGPEPGRPRFDDGPPPPRTIQIAGLDPQCLENRVMPRLVERYFGRRDPEDYEIRVVDENGAGGLYQSSPSASGLTPDNADASVPLFGPPRRDPPPPDGPGRFSSFLPGPDGARQNGLLLLARHKSGSLDAMVASERNRNLAMSGAMLLLILIAGVALVRFARAAQRVSELRMNIVAGVSHELRSPLTVIRTAAFNLQREGFSPRPEQVRRYGELIGAESSRLERLIDNVLQFAAGSAARGSTERVSTDMAELIDCELQFLRDVIDAAGMAVDRDIAAHLPRVAADGGALRHAIRNILENAIKYGKAGGWVGLSARAAGNEIVIRIADRGPGIPPAERARVFEPFFRGADAIHDQVHGAGLGLSLADQIVKAHGGSISVDEESPDGAGFLIRLPAVRETGASA